jgi:hypothetical protein
MHLTPDGRRVCSVAELLGLAYELDASAIGRCRACERKYPSDCPPAIVEVSHLPIVKRIEGLPLHLEPALKARPEWLIRRIERRTTRSHERSVHAGKQRSAGKRRSAGVYTTYGDWRVLKLREVDAQGRPNIGNLRCRRCHRKPPIGVSGLIREAKQTIANGQKYLTI